MLSKLLVVLSAASTASLGCVDESGSSVDWWFMLKHPRWNDRSKDKVIGNGDGNTYVYATSSKSSWNIGSTTVDQTSSLLGKQLAGVYDGTVSNYVFYNDQLPNGSWTATYGHSKGFFAYDSTSAYWVQHSIPDFPNFVADGYKFGSSQMYYGQHAFCMTLTPSALEAAAEVMTYAHPWVYDSKGITSAMPNVAAVVAGKAASGSTSTTVSASWATLHLLGKAVDYNKDMLDSLVAPTLESDFNSQSWLNSGGPIGGYCPVSGYNVTDVQSITLPLTASSTETHTTFVDHSKWAVAPSATPGWWCALDNNHVESQFVRSGLAVCTQQPAVADLLRTAAATVGGCSDGPPSPPPSSNCCFYSAATCSAGQICCSSSKKSYTSESSCTRYGAKHGCVWEADKDLCEIPKSTAPVEEQEQPQKGLLAKIASFFS